MSKLKLIRYNTMNSWNNSTAPAYNLKIYNVIPRELQNKVFELMETEDFYEGINDLIREFDFEQNYQYQAGFNGRSSGYLVLYKGGYEEKIIYPENEFKKDNGYNGRVYSDYAGWQDYNSAKKNGLLNKKVRKTFCYSGQSIEEAPEEVLQAFEKLAENIVNYTIKLAKTAEVKEENYTVTKTRKVIA